MRNRRILAPLRQLRQQGLTRFDAELAWPGKWEPWYGGGEEDVNYFRILSPIAEQKLKDWGVEFVMGSAYVEADARATWQPSRSIWDWVHNKPLA